MVPFALSKRSVHDAPTLPAGRLRAVVGIVSVRGLSGPFESRVDQTVALQRFDGCGSMRYLFYTVRPQNVRSHCAKTCGRSRTAAFLRTAHRPAGHEWAARDR